MRCEQFLIHVEELTRAHDIGRQIILFDAKVVFPVILDDTDPGHLLQDLFEMVFFDAGQFDHLVQGVGLAHLHFETDFGHLIGQHLVQCPILR